MAMGTSRDSYPANTRTLWLLMAKLYWLVRHQRKQRFVKWCRREFVVLLRMFMNRRFLLRLLLGAQGAPAEVAATIAFLASPEAGYITGVERPPAGGQVGLSGGRVVLGPWWGVGCCVTGRETSG
jgi:NAD(P)-dependent dehydrogenase (short-subunit alcohol dehydrogenase family)